jgi:Phage P22-like portal protein
MADEDSTKKEDSKKKDEEILKEALGFFKKASEDEAGNRANYEADVKFGRLGEQWPENIKKQRQDENRPCLTVNRCPSFVRQVVNDARQNKPSIIVHPIDNGADKKTAEVINGVIRAIERNSCADVAYDTAIENAVSGGFGFFRIGIDFADDDSFDMEVRIECVPNSLSVYPDVDSTRFDAADWNYAFVCEVISKDEFESRYPEARPVNFEGGDDSGFHSGLDDDQVRVAEYWRREEISRKIFLLSDGGVIREDQMSDEIRAFFDVTGVSVVKERQVRAHEVTRRIISGVEVLESDPWPGETIPICPVWGEVVTIDGVRYLRSMIRDAKGPQEMLNYWKSASTELVALAPKAPYVVEEGSIPEGEEHKYETANTRSYSYLLYNKGFNAPQRQPFAGVPAGALQEALNASDDMKSVMGIFDAALGSRGNETSGKAILARQRESDVSNFHFTDNQSRAIQYAGKVIVEIIPHVYPPGRVMRILGEDQKEKVVRLAGGDFQPDKESGDEQLYDLTVGKYDVTVKAGPSYASQREETRETIVELIRSIPTAAPEAALVLGVKLLEQMDFLGADELAKQIGTLLPQDIQAMRSDEGDKNLPPEAKQVIALAQKEIEQLKQQLQQGGQIFQEGQKKIQALESDKTLEDKKLNIEDLKIQTEQMKLQREKEQLQGERVRVEGETESQTRLAAIEQNVNAIAAAVVNANEQEAQATLLLAAALNRPQQVIRDDEGRILGIETVGQAEVVNDDFNA